MFFTPANTTPSEAIDALVAAMPALNGLYVICLVVGGGLLLFSALIGGHGHDAVAGNGADVAHDFAPGADAHAEAPAHDADTHHPGGATLSDWFSLRFVIYFAAAFGLFGTVLTYATDQTRGFILGAALAGGGLVGQVAHQLFRFLKRSESDGATRLADYIDRPGRVTLAIRPGTRGEVAVHIRGSERFLPATARRDDETFSPGQVVHVVQYHGGTAVVVSQKEHEFAKQTSNV